MSSFERPQCANVLTMNFTGHHVGNLSSLMNLKYHHCISVPRHPITIPPPPLRRCVVWTGDGRVFFYNPSTRTSVWERPEELNGRADVDKMLQPPKQETAETKDDGPPAKKAKTEEAKKGTRRSRLGRGSEGTMILILCDLLQQCLFELVF